jgi:hypothetical protein
MFVEKTYTIAGTSLFQGENTYRFANGAAKSRTATLVRGGHDNVNFVTLPRPMTLKDAVAFLKAQGIAALLPQGQRRGLNGRQEGYVPERKQVEEVAAAEQQDAHVQAHAAFLEEAAAKKAAFVARMTAARAAKRAAAAA